ncbi:hypothetical protein RI103_06280 [Paraburkholderia sp. FT54]|uniref:head-tail joining protein n=1 Tax=Paraburkholderia sp. FT54 TaxID=3074437 RepID=UPI00287812C9|nr:hypothetical protein [Paraburkholderia sp. FT54]WNC90954.1 hypothetical protein RI103_06280 [Paraburkholderia sp. FT54]
MSIDWDSVVIGPLHGVFAEPATFMPFAGGSFSITVVFDDAYLKEVMFEDATMGATEVSACVGVQLSQFPADPVQNDRLFIPAGRSGRRPAANYLVKQVRPDSRGAARLLLTRTIST